MFSFMKSLGLACSLFFFTSAPVSAAEMKEPGGTPAATQIALFNPDEYAWQLFFYLSQQAEAGSAGRPDASKTSFQDYDDDKDVVWETWALASGENVNKSEVFRRPAVKPVAWEELRAAPKEKVLSPSLKSSPLIRLRGISIDSDEFSSLLKSGARPKFMPDPRLAGLDETRMNRDVFDAVRDNRLYSREGIAAKYDAALKDGQTLVFAFNQNAKEVKARWVQISEQDKARYHWRELSTTDTNGNPVKQIWGLAALHIITRDVPNWFWADFGHVDFEKQATCPQDPDVCPKDTTTRGPNAPSGQNGIRNETRGSKWENYILRGTQTDFVSANGKGTVLSNPIIEETFQRSSCITCHANSAVKRDGTGVEALGMNFDIGAPKHDDFTQSGPSLVFLQMDFLWSIPFRAGFENEPAAPKSLLLGGN